jgi:hypothetical protein
MNSHGIHEVIYESNEKIRTWFTCYCEKPHIDVQISKSVNGNHILVCPTCGHKHYRVIENGHITKERFSESAQNKGSILMQPSAAYAEKPVIGLISRARQGEAVGEFRHWGDTNKHMET